MSATVPFLGHRILKIPNKHKNTQDIQYLISWVSVNILAGTTGICPDVQPQPYYTVGDGKVNEKERNE